MIELLVRVGSGQRSPNRVGHTHVTMPPARLLVDSAHIKKNRIRKSVKNIPPLQPLNPLPHAAEGSLSLQHDSGVSRERRRIKMLG